MSERALLLTGAGNATERAAATPSRYELAFEGDVGVAEWDAFVIAAGGHHAQSSTWADVKRVLGWSATRLVVRDHREIVAGAQVLVRDVGRSGCVGTCAHGPMLTRDDPRLIETVHRGLIELSRGERIRYLKAQPPAGSSDLGSGLRGHGWTPSSMPAAPSATVRVDLSAPEDEILARMRQATRKTIRRGEKRGLVVREGGRGDFDAYYRIIEATSHRQGFTPYPRRYYETLWEAFAERDGSCLVLAELDGIAHAATLVIGFGEAATCKMGGWSGERSRVRPNEPMHFAAMRWAKGIGCGVLRLRRNRPPVRARRVA